MAEDFKYYRQKCVTIPFPTQKDFVTFICYSGKEEMKTISSAVKANEFKAESPSNWFKIVGEDNYKKARAEWTKQENQAESEWKEALKLEHGSEIPEEVFNKCFNLAWEDGHSAGHEEVVNYLETYIDLAEFAYFAGKKF
jgi:flagellar biosynthesis/type III secretory pathway protein FliH